MVAAVVEPVDDFRHHAFELVVFEQRKSQSAEIHAVALCGAEHLQTVFAFAFELGGLVVVAVARRSGEEVHQRVELAEQSFNPALPPRLTALFDKAAAFDEVEARKPRCVEFDVVAEDRLQQPAVFGFERRGGVLHQEAHFVVGGHCAAEQAQQQGFCVAPVQAHMRAVVAGKARLYQP